MIEGIILTWFVLTALSLIFVVIDIPKTPESIVLKWAFVILVVSPDLLVPFSMFLAAASL